MNKSSDVFTFSVNNHIANIHMLNDGFLFGVNLEELNKLVELLRQFEQDDDVRIVAFSHEKNIYSESCHQEFYKNILGERKKDLFSKNIRRHLNGLANFAELFANYKKLTVVYLDDEISTPYFGLSLVFDLRLACTGMSFCLSHTGLGLPPIGGLTYLLPRFIGVGKATEYLMMGGRITSEEARDYGLVNAILPEDNFEVHCDEWLHQRMVQHSNIIATRQLLYFKLDEYKKYLEQERKLSVKIFNKEG